MQLIVLVAVGFGSLSVMAFLMYVVFYFAGLDPNILSSSDLEPTDTTKIQVMKWIQILQAIGLFIIPYIVYRRLAPHHRSYEPLRIPYVSTMATLVFAASILASFPLINYLAEWNSSLVFPIEGVNTWMHETEQNAERIIQVFLHMDGPMDLVLNLILLALVPAIGEELLFRGTMQPLLLRSFKSYHLAIWITAFWFSFFHLQFLGFVPRMLLGAVLGYAAHWSGSLMLPMIGHFANNALAVTLAYFIGTNALQRDVETLGASDHDLQLVAISTLMLLAGMSIVLRSSTFQSLDIKKPSSE